MTTAAAVRGDQATKPAVTLAAAELRAVSPYRYRRYLNRIGLYVSVIILISPAILFFFWMLSLSLKTELDNTTYPPVFIPHPPTLANFIDVFAKNDFLLYGINSVIVSDRKSVV